MPNNSNQQEQQQGAQFEALAGRVTALFNQIQAQAIITQADASRANMALGELAAFVAQYPVPYVTQKWEGPHYRTVYEQRLQQIMAAAASYAAANPAAAAAASAPGGAAATSASATGSLLANPVMLLGLIFGAVYLFKR